MLTVKKNNNALGIVFPNSYDNTVPELVTERLMASIPFAGRYRLIDFVLSSMSNSGIDNVSVIVRKNYHSLMDHLGTGAAWDMARNRGGLNIVPPFAEKEVKIYNGRVEALSSIMTFLAGAFSSIKISYVSSNFEYVKVAVIIYTVCFALFLILKLKNQKIAIAVLLGLYAVCTVLPTVSSISSSNTETVAYYSDYKCDQVLIRSENEVCLINSAQYSKNLAYTSLDFLEDANVTYLDKYYLTHYSWSIDDEIEVLMYNLSVKEIYVPEPRNEDEEAILKILYKTVEDRRTKIVVFREYETVTVGNYTVNLLYSEPYGNTSMNAFVVAKGNEIYTYISSGLLASDKRDMLTACISLSDHLILGDHGKKYKSRIYIEECYPDLDSIIIHSDNVFLKQDNMQYYLDRYCNIYSQPEKIIYFLGK